MFVKRRSMTSRKFYLGIFLIVTLFIGEIINAKIGFVVFSPPLSILVNMSDLHPNVTFNIDSVYLYNGIAYDFYSIGELKGDPNATFHWKTFPLPNESFPTSISAWKPRHHPKINISIDSLSNTMTGLSLVDHIYIVTSPKLTDRQENLQGIFHREGIKNYEFRQKWQTESCYSPENQAEVHRKLNLRPQRLPEDKRRQQCAVTMEHVDIWHDIVLRNYSFVLILEDDAIFVPSFREKFDRTIYTALRSGVLKRSGLRQCLNHRVHLTEESEEWIDQEPIIVIGSCMQLFDQNFPRQKIDAPPQLSTHKSSGSRCSHAYLLTKCSTQALLDQISHHQNSYYQSDLFLNFLIRSSPKLQSFWLDPPIVYQGNRIVDFDGIRSFSRTSYRANN